MVPGALIDERFEVVHPAGAGGMGTVYRGVDRSTGEAVAIKVLHRWASAEAERFHREALLLAELSSPGIVRYVAHGVTGEDEHWLAMEWLDGETLTQRLARDRLTALGAVQVALQTARALAPAHARGVVHRDINPNNLLLEGGAIDRLKLLDFGIAKRLGGASAEAKLVVGTLGYMAPEQARGMRELDARADVFSLGCLLFECLTGRPAFEGRDLMAVLAKILLQETPRVGELCAGAPPELDALLSRMLAKEPVDRPADAAALVDDLAELEATLAAAPPAALELADFDVGAEEAWGGRDLVTGSRALRAALSESEQRVLCVVLVGEGPRTGVRDLAAADEQETLVRRAAAPWGARVEGLADGSMVLTLTGERSAVDDAGRAARCALALRALVPCAPMALVARRGILAGRLPFGEVIDEGVRALRAAAPGTIRLDEVAEALLEPRFAIATGDGATLVGDRDVMDAARTVLGKTTTCVGRDAELDALDDLLRGAMAGGARAALVTAPAGWGKSRLRWELLERVRRRGEEVELLLGQAEPLAAEAPFALIAQAVRRAAGILDGESLDVRRRKLDARIRRAMGGEAPRVRDFLGELIDLQFPDEGSDALRAARRDPRLMGDAIRAAWQDWLEAECARRPLLLVLDDVHWGDLPSIELVDAALRALSGRRLFVLALARPEVHQRFPRLWADRGLREIPLTKLVDRDAIALVDQILGARADRETRARIVARADGSPFFLEELVRAVAAGRGDALPETVLGVIQERLDELGPEAKRVLRAASVFGQAFQRGGVAALLGDGVPVEIVDRCLDDLVEREVILRGAGGFAGEAGYAFRQALQRDAAYSMLTEGDRVLGHRLAGEWLESSGALDAALLGEHFLLGEEPARAMAWFGRAALGALEGSDLEAAIAHAERAVTCGAQGESLVALRIIQAQAQFWRGQYAEAEARAGEATREALAGTPSWFQAAGEIIAALGQLRRYDRLDEWVVTVEETPASPYAQRPALMCLARAVGYLMDAGRSVTAILDRIAREAETREIDPALAAAIHHAYAKRAILVGDFGAAVERFAEAVTAFERAGDARSVAESRVALGYLMAELGDWDGAQGALEQAHAAGARMGSDYIAVGALHNLGPVLAQRGDRDGAWRVESEAAEFFERQGDLRLAGISRAYLSTIAFLSGDPARAEAEARRAAQLTEEMPPAHASALAALARVLLERGRVGEALDVAVRGMALLESLGGIEDYEALLRRVHAEALAATGATEEAARAIRRACERLRDRAGPIADPERRVSFLERVPENARTFALAQRWRVAT